MVKLTDPLGVFFNKTNKGGLCLIKIHVFRAFY